MNKPILSKSTAKPNKGKKGKQLRQQIIKYHFSSDEDNLSDEFDSD